MHDCLGLLPYRTTQKNHQGVHSGIFLKGNLHSYNMISLNSCIRVSNLCYATYSVEDSTWATEGLRTVSVTRDGDTITVICTSSHLTSFAVLVDVAGVQVLCLSIYNLHSCTYI